MYVTDKAEAYLRDIIIWIDFSLINISDVS